MLTRDAWQEISATLSRNKLRTFLTAWGVFWGVFLLLVMLAISSALERGVEQEFFGRGANEVFVWGGRTHRAYQGMQDGRRISFRTEDIPSIQALKNVAIVAPRGRLGGWRGGINVTRGTKIGNFNIMADYPQLALIRPPEIIEGRFINKNDIDERRKVAVIGPSTYKVLYSPGESPIGSSIKIQGVYFQVIGHLKKDLDTDSEVQSIHVPFTTFQNAFNVGNRVGWFALTAKENTSAKTLEDDVRATLMRIHRVHPEDKSAIGSFNAAEEVAKIKSIFTGMRLFGWVVGIGTLLMGVIGVSNIMLITVKERTREFGLRKALGATPRLIVTQVLQETLVLTSIPGYLGVVIGAFLLETFGPMVEENTPLGMMQARVDVALVALVILVISGLLAGFFPAKHASRIRPIEALRTD